MGMRTSSALQTTNNRQFDQRITLVETKPLKMLEFFAGSGLVSAGLNGMFQPVWANDICSKKAEVYKANHPKKKFILDDIKNINGADLPRANLAWASFPCQDLSLAGLTGGIHANRSGLVWQWLRIIDEMPVKPRVLVAENVTGLVSYASGENYRLLHNALFERNYKVGAIVLDAVKFVPQSRPRVFVIAVSQDVAVPKELMDSASNWLHPVSITRAAAGLPGWIWWKAPLPSQRKINLNDIVEWEVTSEPDNVVQRYLEIMNPCHKERLINMNEPAVATGYKRTRNGKQVLELRFDGIAGCLRTPNGGSSRQILIIKRDGKIGARLLTVRETARLMGAPDNFLIPGGYNDGYRAMGDAVAFPVVKFLGKHILLKLTKAAYHV